MMLRFRFGLLALALMALALCLCATTASGPAIDMAQCSEPTTRASGIDPTSPPHLNATKSVSNMELWQYNDYRSPRNTTVHLNISGSGNPAINFNSQEVVFTIDVSSSMNQADPAYLRRAAAINYVDQLIAPDHAAVIQFSDHAELIGEHHLSSDYAQVVADLNSITNQGQTNFTDAIETTNRELIDHGKANTTKICILLTDGKPEPITTNITLDVLNETVSHNITIYTIGLYKFGSSTLIDENLLRWIAARTGGEYYFAQKPTDLMAIYDKIAARFRNYTAGYDPDVTDGVPMVRDVVPQGFFIDNNSFNIRPSARYLGQYNWTVLEWNVSQIMIGQTLRITYNISSNLFGQISLHPYGTARVRYWVGQVEHEVPFNPVAVWVLSSIGVTLVPPPPPPPPPPAPPPPPPGGYPIPITTPASPTMIPLSPPTGLPAAANPIIFPVEYLVAGFIGLGIIERLKIRKLLKTRQKVAVGT